MKIALLVQKKQRIIFDRLYDAIQKYTNCDVFWLTSKEQKNLKSWFSKRPDMHSYDRIVLFLRFKHERHQVKFLRTVPNLVFFEHDACQNYIPGEYQEKFSKCYQKLPWARVLVSGYSVSTKFQGEGLDAIFVPKGYDESMIKNRGQTRDIELGFVGSLDSKIYNKRQLMLMSIAEKENLFITKTNSGSDYVNMLNRIRFFISADTGIGEYMIKNFEAMGSGCLLFSWNQGERENRALGFKDMENMVLYSSVDECRQKLDLLRKDKTLAENIAKSGQKHAEEFFTFDHIGKKIAEALRPPLRKKTVYRYLGFRQYEWSY